MLATKTAPVIRPRRSQMPSEEFDLAGWSREVASRHPSVGFAVALVRDGRLSAFAAHGPANVESGAPITQDTVFRIASISKTMTAIAVMQLHEQGLIDLDAPAAEYLRAFRLIPSSSGTRPATVRHLLTHTAGVPEVVRATDLLRPDWGDSVALDERLPTLAEFYRGGIQLHGEPGTTFTYTNHGFATLQQIVEDVSDVRFEEYLRERLFVPLGMEDTSLHREARLVRRLATGYTPGDRGPRPVIDRAWTTPGASSVYSTTRDMGRYVAALMGGGSNEHGTVLRPETMAMMFAPHYRPDPRVPGMGLGFDREEADGHLVIGHGGILPGVNSQMFVAPDDGVGLIAWVTGGHLAMLWLPTETGGLLNRLIGVPLATIRTDVPPRTETWRDLCGHYRPKGRLTDIRARLLTGFGADVFVRGNRLILRVLSPVPALLRGMELHPDSETDPDVFRVDLSPFGLPTARIVFSRERGAPATAMHLDIFPMSLHRRSPSPRSRASRAALALGAVIAIGVGFWARGRRRRTARSAVVT